MGHEIAHALQRHGVERMSRSIIDQIAQLGAIGRGLRSFEGRRHSRPVGRLWRQRVAAVQSEAGVRSRLHRPATDVASRV